jgi:hypothetical protein
VTDSGDGAGATLRNQVAAANPADTVAIDAGVNPTLGGTEVPIDRSLTITGQGAKQTTVSANSLSRIAVAALPGAVAGEGRVGDLERGGVDDRAARPAAERSPARPR